MNRLPGFDSLGFHLPGKKRVFRTREGSRRFIQHRTQHDPI